MQGPLQYRGFTITLRHTTLGRTPLEEGSACRKYPPWKHTTLTRDRYPCVRQDSPAMLASERPQTHTFDRAAIATGNKVYTGCPRRNVPDFGRVFLMLKYTNITQNTYVQCWTVTEIMAREVWNFDSCYTLNDYQIHIKTGRNMWFL